MADYNLTSLDLPVVKGVALRALAAALETGAGRALLLGSLLNGGGIDRLREMEICEDPRFLPLVPADEPPSPRIGRRRAGPSARELARCATVSSPDETFCGAGDYAERYASGDLTPTDVAERFLAALEADRRSPQPLCPFITVDPDDVRRQAAESAERHRRGKPLGPLDGVPVAIKDEVDMAGYPTTVGTAFLGRPPAAADATTVARLRSAGALLLGKANMHEIGINPTGHNVHHGHARNPYSPDHDAGGSSSGPAGAVAAGLAAFSLGADGGGSIRVPAAHCGLVGLKPTFGRVSERGSVPLGTTVGHLGPIGVRTADVTLAYATIAGADPADPNTLVGPPVSIDGWDRRDLAGVRLGVYRPWFEHADGEVVALCDDLLKRLVETGARVVEITIHDLDALRIAHAVTILSEMAAAMWAYDEHRKEFAPATRVSLALGRSFGGVDYLRAQHVRGRAMREFQAIYETVDAIITPTSAIPAPRIPADGLPAGISDLSTVTEIMRYAIPGNMLGLPAISFPAGYTDSGLPVGMQAMASHWQEALLLGIANVAERLVERQPPAVRWNLLSE